MIEKTNREKAIELMAQMIGIKNSIEKYEVQFSKNYAEVKSLIGDDENLKELFMAVQNVFNISLIEENKGLRSRIKMSEKVKNWKF